jgi:hypothetical protein
MHCQSFEKTGGKRVKILRKVLKEACKKDKNPLTHRMNEVLGG